MPMYILNHSYTWKRAAFAVLDMIKTNVETDEISLGLAWHLFGVYRQIRKKKLKIFYVCPKSPEYVQNIFRKKYYYLL